MTTARVTVVRDEIEAEMFCGLLRANGVKCAYRQTNEGAALWTGKMATIGPIEVVVNQEDLDTARAVLSEGGGSDVS
jgi:hypothetical protein